MSYTRANELIGAAAFEQEIITNTHRKVHQQRVAPVMCTEEDLEMEEKIKKRILTSNPVFVRAKSEMGNAVNLISRRRHIHYQNGE